jgi:hypothetical protein
MFTDCTSNPFSLVFLAIFLGFPSITLKYVPQNFSPSVFLFIVFYCSSGFEEKYAQKEREGIKSMYYAPAFAGFNIMPDIYKCCLCYPKNTETLLNISAKNITMRVTAKIIKWRKYSPKETY